MVDVYEMTSLPDDIWYMVCTELWYQQDFNTLFNCVCSGKQLANIAVIYLYRYYMLHQSLGEVKASRLMDSSMQHLADGPDIIRGRNKRWTCRWRTILLSSMGKTLYPYSQFIRTLDLQELELGLRGSKLRDRISK